MEIFKLFGRIFIDNDPANRRLDETDARAAKVGNTLANTARTAARWGAAIAAGATAAGTAMFALVNRVTDTAAAIDAKRKQLGVTSEALQEYSYAADQVGVAQDSMERALGRLNQRIGLAERGNEKYRKSLQELGVTSRNTDEAFLQAIDALHQMDDASLQAAAAADLFGTQLARQLMPVIRAGGDELLALRNRAHELGKVMDQDSTIAANNFQSALSDVRGVIGGISQDLVMRVLPTFEKWMVWIADNLPKAWAVFEFLGEVVAIVFKYMRLIIGDGIKWMRENAIGPFVTWLTDVWQERGPPIIAAVQALWDGIKAVFSTVFEALRGLWDAFVLAFQGDWEGAWEKVKETALGIWNALPELFSDLFGPLTDIVDWIMQGVISVIRSVFGDDVADHFESIWNAVLVVFEVFEETFLGLWRAFSALFQGDWQTAWDEVKGVATTIWNALPVVFESIINGLIGIADTIMSAVIGVIRSVFGDEVAGIFETAWDAVKVVFEGARDILLGIWTALTAAFQGDWSAAWESIQGVVETAWATIETVVDSGLSIIRTLIDGVLNGIVALVRWAFGDEAATVVDDAFDVIRDVIDVATEAIMGIVRIFAALFAGEWEEAWEETKSVAAGLWNALPGLFESAVNALVGIADTIMTAVIGVIRNLFGDNVADHFEGVWNAVKTVFETATNVILGVWRTFTALFSGDWGGAWEEAKNTFFTAWESLPGIVSGILDGIFGIVDAAAQAIIDLLRSWFGDGVADVFQAAWDTITIVFETARDSILGILGVFMSLFRGEWEEAWQGVLGIFEGIWSGIKEIFEGPLNGVVEFVGRWVSQIVNWFGALRDMVASFVRDTVDGITEWFSESKLGKAFGWVGDQVRGVTGWFADMYDKVVGNSYVPDMVEEIGEAIARLKDRLANPVARYTSEVIADFEDMEDEVVASMISMAERMDDVLKTISDRISGMISDVTRQFWNGTATWSSILNTFAGAAGSIFGAVFDAIAKEFVSNLILQNEWVVKTLANIATTITGLLAQVYATLVAFYAWSGPLAPALAAGTMAAVTAAIASIGGNIIRGLLPDAPGGGSPDVGSGDRGGGGRSGGRQVSEITGPTRDLLIDLLTPLASLNSLTGIGERIYSLLDERLAPPGMAYAGADLAGGAPQITFEPGSILIYPQTSGTQSITDDTVDEIERKIAERMARRLRGRGG